MALSAAEGLKLAAEADRVVATRGKNVIELNLKKDKPTKEELAKLLIGPSGNLRAPAARIGKTLVIGFDEKMYESEFGS